MSIVQAIETAAGKKNKYKKTIRFISGVFAYTLFGFLFSVSGIGEGFSPFGVAFAAASDKKHFPAAFCGAVIGYIIGNDTVTALRYCAALLALAVIFGALRAFPKILKHPLSAPTGTFSCLAVTGLAIVLSKEVTTLSVLLCLSEALLGAGASYLFVKCRALLYLKGGIWALTSKEATAVVIACSLLLLAVKDIAFFGVSPARIICIFIILVCARYAREAGGAIVGICCGVTMSFSGGSAFITAFYSFGGLIAGVVSSLGRVASFAAFCLAGIAVFVISSEKPIETVTLIETLFAGTVFLLMPRSVTAKFESILTPAVHSPIIDSVKNSITRKLKKASAVSSEICTSLTGVSQVLAKSECADIKDVCRKTRDGVCGSCGLFDNCWNESFDETQDFFNTFVIMKKEGTYLEYKNMPQRFSAKCIRTELIAESFNKLYTEYKVRQKLESRVNEIYTLAAGQFVNVSALLDSLCDSVCENVRFDPELAARFRAAAGACGLKSVSSCCAIDSYEHLRAELTVKNDGSQADVQMLTKQLEAVCDCSFKLPEIRRKGDEITFFYTERPVLRVINCAVQSCAGGEKYIGDAFSAFEADDGCFYAAVCDGMGTGAKASVNSNLAVSLLEKLLSAGFGAEAAINTVNTSLISKSGDECSVTLDLAAVDLFTGHITFYKCGAAPTFVKKQGKITGVSFSSLPLGIIHDCESAVGTGFVSAGDIAVMASDGVRDEDIPYLKDSLKRFSGGNVRDFTNQLCENIRERQPKRTDDLTLLTLAFTSYD